MWLIQIEVERRTPISKLIFISRELVRTQCAAVFCFLGSEFSGREQEKTHGDGFLRIEIPGEELAAQTRRQRQKQMSWRVRVRGTTNYS